jgi:hypothetical protein
MLPVSSGQRPTADYKFAYHFKYLKSLIADVAG